MKSEDITPHLNKIATVYLRNNKKKVGWLFLDDTNHIPTDPFKEVYFVNVQRGRRLIHTVDQYDTKALEKVRESIPVNEIIRIRSSL